MAQTFGQFLVNEQLPEDLRTTTPVDKADLHKRLYTYVGRDPIKAAVAVDKLRALGHALATSEGATITLDDITPNYAERNAILRPALEKVKTITDAKERQRHILAAQEKILATAKGFGGSQGELVRAGARGAPVQLMRSFVAPVAARDAHGGVAPWLIHHSYSEGLRPSEAYAAASEARLNVIASHTSITEPGDFSKILVNSATDQLILSEDCGTKNGVVTSTDDPNIIDRFLAKPAGGFAYNTVITPQVATKLRRNTESVVVRSPMTCELNDGVCQHCYGKNERGALQTLGTNIGVRSAQAITEPLTQFTLSARHGLRRGGEQAGAATAVTSELSGIKGLRQFLDVPQSFANRAELASADGKVESIHKAPQGGHFIQIGEQRTYVPPHLAPIVRPGQAVNAGDALSEGIPMPNDVVKYKGLGAGRKYIVDQLQNIYRAQGVDLDRRHFEVLARAVLNKVQIDDDPERRFYPGEVVNYSVIQHRLAKDQRPVPLARASGEVLAQAYLHHTAGTRVTTAVIKDLENSGIKTVNIAAAPPLMSFVMAPVTQNPLLNPDWMARMGHRQIKQTITEAAQMAQTTDIHGTHPVPAYAFGSEFGQGKGGRY